MSILPKDIRNYLGYTFQFFAIITISTFIGYFIDKKYLDKSVFIWLLPTISIIISLIKIVISTNKKGK